MNQTQTATTIKTTQPVKHYFHCRSCQRDRPIEQLGKIIKGNNSKRCIFCCDNADAGRALIAKCAAQ